MIKNPKLRDRLHALAVFTGIAIGGVSGVEMVIGGGFDTITPAFAFEASAPHAWYDRPIEPGMGWISAPYTPVASTLDVSQQFGDGYPIDSDYDPGAVEDLDGAPRETTPAYTRTVHTDAVENGPALVSAADEPLSDEQIEAIAAEAERYVDEINELYAQEHAAEIEQRQVELDEIDPTTFGSGSPL
jgi:hypothetical protein